jgi:peroxiredoxin Q/BCP
MLDRAGAKSRVPFRETQSRVMSAWILVAAAFIAVGLIGWQVNAHIKRQRPRPGDAAPTFSLPDQNGRTRALEEFRGRWLVLYFYPRDDTPGCTEQAGRYRDALQDIETLGATVCGISVNDSDSHARFARKYKLSFTLLADRGGRTAARYGSLLHFGLIRVARRNTFLIDPRGRIAKVYVGVNAARDAAAVLADLRITATAAA